MFLFEARLRDVRGQNKPRGIEPQNLVSDFFKFGRKIRKKMPNFDPYNENYTSSYIAFLSYCAHYQA